MYTVLMKTVLLVFLLSVGSTAVAAAAGGALLLRYTAAPGDSCAYDVQLRSGMAVRGMSAGANSTMRSTMTVQVSDSTVQQLGINVGVESVQVAVQGAPGMPDTTVSMDIGQNAKLRVIIDRRGAIVFAWPTSGLVDAYEARTHIATGVQTMLRKLFLSYPADSVRVGTSWSNTTADTAGVGGIGVITTAFNTLTYSGIVDTLGVRCARVALASDSVSVRGQGGYQNNTVAVHGSGRLAGLYYIDLRTGLPLAGDIQSYVDMEFAVLGAAVPQEQASTVKMSTTSDFILRRKAPVR